MSNPGVIVLAEEKPRKKYLFINKDSFRRFQIEDNIGESIHIHLDNFRFDLTISEYLLFSKTISKVLEELLIENNVEVSKLDPIFFNKSSEHWPHIKKISIETVELSNLRCIIHGNNNYKRKHIPIKKTPAFLYLTNNNKKFLGYQQDSYIGQNNKDRLLNLLSSLQRHGYPYKDNYIILLGNQNYIRDGQHRAACLLYLGYKEIPIKRIIFDDNYSRYREKNDYIKYFIDIALKSSIKIKKILKKLRNSSKLN